MDNFPCMEVMAAKYLRKEFPELKAIAMDSISYDSAITGGDEGFPCHHALLETNSEQKERTLLLFEDVNIQKVIRCGKNKRNLCISNSFFHSWKLLL